MKREYKVEDLYIVKVAEYLGYRENDVEQVMNSPKTFKMINKRFLAVKHNNDKFNYELLTQNAYATDRVKDVIKTIGELAVYDCIPLKLVTLNKKKIDKEEIYQLQEKLNKSEAIETVR